MYGAVVDITERRRAETALHESEDRLRQAVRVASLGIFDHDHATNKFYWSPELRAIYGFDSYAPPSLDEYIARVHPEDRSRIAGSVRRAHNPAGDGLFDVEHRLVLPGGGIRWIATRSLTFFEGEGDERHAVRTVGAVTDITAARRAQEEQRNLASVVAMSSEFMGVATPDGHVVYMNQAAMSLVGIGSIEEARQKDIADFFSDSCKAQAEKEMMPALERKGTWYGESRFRHFRTGEEIDVAMAAFPVFDDAGAPVYIATVTRDITEIKRAEADKAKLEERLFQAQKMESIGRLAGGVAHDFNNMLTVILGYVELAKARRAPADVLEGYLDEIQRAANRSRQLAEQVLGFSRRQIIAPKPTDLNALLADLRNPLSRLIGEDIELAFYPERELGTASLDSSQVHQIVLNLAVNARDAMPKGGRLTIETANVKVSEEHSRTHVGGPPGDYIMLAISDGGTGMSRDVQAHIFEPFFTTKEQGKGTGLALATVYGIVRQNHGFVNVYSEVGQGTTFKIYFPRLACEAQAAERRGIA
jgi:two-component system, cell cycle sensor histidine kinase and response regulator CckA